MSFSSTLLSVFAIGARSLWIILIACGRPFARQLTFFTDYSLSIVCDSFLLCEFFSTVFFSLLNSIFKFSICSGWYTIKNWQTRVIPIPIHIHIRNWNFQVFACVSDYLYFFCCCCCMTQQHERNQYYFI